MTTSPAVYTDPRWRRQQTFLQLAERVEGGERGWNINLVIEKARGRAVEVWPPPAVTNTADAAFALIPPGWFVAHFSDDGPKRTIYCKLACRTQAIDVDSVGAPTRAAAITAAALRAWAREAE